MLIKAKSLKGYVLQGRDGDIGSVKEFYFDDRHWAIRYLVADTGSWLTERQVLISPYALQEANPEKRRLVIDLTKKQIEDSPPLDTDKTVSQQYEETYYRYYGWPVYWTGSSMWGYYPIIVRDREKWQATDVGDKTWNPHLRSTRAVSGYTIKANDGEIGHVDDYILDDETWAIRYLVVDTRNWLPGKKVLISPTWIERISWDESTVIINLSREAIKLSPEYSEAALLTQEYETDLHGYYNRLGNWTEASADTKKKP